MNKLPIEKRAQIIGLLVEGNSLRSTSRLTSCSINTVTKMLVDAGKVCSDYQNETLRNLKCKRIQCDEIWSFCYAKEKNVPTELKGKRGIGDVWTWTAICADTKLVPSWIVGDRSGLTGRRFIRDLKSRLANRVQLTTDGHKVYLDAVDTAFGGAVDYSMLVKLYSGEQKNDTRYSADPVIGIRKDSISGFPDPKHVSTSFVERQNLTMRMSMRRFTRLTNAFSKKVENHIHAVSLHFMYYNFCRIHKSLRVTPAMEAGVSNKVWEIKDIIELIDAREIPQKRGAYKKRISN